MTSEVPYRSQKKVTRIIARLNIGGPAIQAITLSQELEPFGYRTRLIRGVEDPAEGNMDYLASERGVVPTLIPSMRRDPGLGDLVALAQIVLLLWRDRPAIVHTHAAKGGTLGRLATVLAFPLRRMRPVVIHTYHGHSLTGYFSGRTAGFYRLIEKLLARHTDVLLAVSSEVRDDLVGLKVAPAGHFRVMPLGFDLSPFTDDVQRAQRRRTLREQWGADDLDVVVTLIARLVPIKRVDRFLAVARQVADRAGVRFVVVGDGELRDELASSADAAALGARLVWAGFRRDIPDVCFASDIVMLTSDNEGTPVSLIEAQAAAVPVVATDVGGVRSAVRDGETGRLAPPGAIDQLADSVSQLIDDPDLRARIGAAGRAHATSLYTLQRLAADHAALYDELLALRLASRQAR
jgi:glycosyltransferase involved in cell wall biosynthesis